MEESRIMTSWESFSKTLQIRFETSFYDDLMKALVNFRSSQIGFMCFQILID